MCSLGLLTSSRRAVPQNMLDYIVGDKVRYTDTTVKVRVAISMLGSVLAFVALYVSVYGGFIGGSLLDQALSLKIVCGLLAVFFMQFLLVPGFFLYENFADPPAEQVRGENYSLVIFFMRLFGLLGVVFLWLVLTTPIDSAYGKVCTLVALVAFMGPAKADLIFPMTAKHVVAPVMMLIMGALLLAASY